MSRAIVAFIAALMLALPAGAQTIPNFQSVELTRDSAGRALDAMPAVYEVGQEYEARAPAASDDDLVAGLAGLGLYAQAKADLDAAVGAHGFASYEDWMATIQTLFHAYAFAKSSDAMAEAAPAMRQALEQIQNDPRIPEAQKQAMIAQMNALAGAHSTMAANAPSENNRAVALELGGRIEATSAAIRQR